MLNDGTREEIEKQGLELLGVVPHDDTVYEFDCDGKPTVQLPDDSPVKKQFGRLYNVCTCKAKWHSPRMQRGKLWGFTFPVRWIILLDENATFILRRFINE